MTQNVKYKLQLHFTFRHYLKLPAHTFQMTHNPSDYGYDAELLHTFIKRPQQKMVFYQVIKKVPKNLLEQVHKMYQENKSLNLDARNFQIMAKKFEEMAAAGS